MNLEVTRPTTGLIAEDEAPQRRALHELLRQLWPDLQLVAVCEDGVAALEAVERCRPDIAFLDIRMPGVGGLDVARAVVAQGGLVVFITAHDDHAVSAFEAGAIDYLVKPLHPLRLERAVARLQQRLALSQPPDVQSLIDALETRLRPAAEHRVRWISASLGDSVSMIGIDEVLYFQAQDKYLRVVTATGEALIRTPLKELLAGLDPDQFWQVHRGVAVRVSAVARVHRDELGRLSIHLKQRPETLPVSATFAHRFRGM